MNQTDDQEKLEQFESGDKKGDSSKKKELRK
jgi:hypothetical protein